MNIDNQHYLQLQELTKRAQPLDRFGCYVAVLNNYLFTCPMLENGQAEMHEDYSDCMDFAQVICVEDIAFIQAVNQMFQTKFTLAEFS